MKFILFLLLLTAFILDVLYPARIGGLVGLTIPNITMYTVGLALILSETFSGRVASRPMPGVKFAIIALIGTVLSVVHAKYYGVVEVSLMDNTRRAKELVFEPVLLYLIAFLLIDNREQGLRYMMMLVLVIGSMNVASVIGAQMGIQLFQARGYFVEDGQTRLAGFVGNPNKTSYLICVLLPFLYYLYKHNSRTVVKTLLVLVMIMSVYVILLSGSRGGMLLVALLFIGMAFRFRDLKIVYGGIIAGFGIALLIASDATFFQQSMERVARLTQGNLDTASSGRMQIWGSLLSEYTNDYIGMVFGRGFGAAESMGIGARAHNMYLEILIEFGFIGLIIFLFFIGSVIRGVSKKTFDDRELKFAVLLSAYVVIFAWFFTTLIGVLQLISITWAVAFATLSSRNRNVALGKAQ